MKEKSEIEFSNIPEVKERSKVLYIIVFICVFIIFNSGILRGISFFYNNKLISNYIFILMEITILYIVLKETINRDIKCFFKEFKKYFKYTMKSAVILFILTSIINSAIMICLDLDSVSKNEEEILNTSIGFLQYIVILGPIAEELLFRGLIRKIINNDYAFIIVSSILFGSIHILGKGGGISEWLFLIPYAVPGFILACNYKKTNNLVTVMIMHMFFNMIRNIT